MNEGQSSLASLARTNKTLNIICSSLLYQQPLIEDHESFGQWMKTIKKWSSQRQLPRMLEVCYLASLLTCTRINYFKHSSPSSRSAALRAPNARSATTKGTRRSTTAEAFTFCSSWYPSTTFTSFEPSQSSTPRFPPRVSPAFSVLSLRCVRRFKT